tara:strand:- start:23361 stop:23804 length:444 start_codon:yes stop_codon:yes gene_type:complete
MAVLRSAFSLCSNPRRNNTGSVNAIFTLTPPPEATGLSSGSGFTLLIILFADVRPEDQCESESVGRGIPDACIALTAPIEFLGLERISLFTGDIPSGNEATELRLLLVDDRGVGMSVVSGAREKLVSMNDRKYRFALSLGPASFSMK